MAVIVNGVSWAAVGPAALAPLKSNEIFAAHFSMYGALHYHLPFTWGASAVNLVASAVPRLAWPNRPPDVYAYYVNGVGAMEGQGTPFIMRRGGTSTLASPGSSPAPCSSERLGRPPTTHYSTTTAVLHYWKSS